MFHQLAEQLKCTFRERQGMWISRFPLSQHGFRLVVATLVGSQHLNVYDCFGTLLRPHNFFDTAPFWLDHGVEVIAKRDDVLPRPPQ